MLNRTRKRVRSPFTLAPKTFENAAVISTVRPTVHIDPDENGAFQKVNAFQAGGVLKRRAVAF